MRIYYCKWGTPLRSDVVDVDLFIFQVVHINPSFSVTLNHVSLLLFLNLQLLLMLSQLLSLLLPLLLDELSLLPLRISLGSWLLLLFSLFFFLFFLLKVLDLLILSVLWLSSPVKTQSRSVSHARITK